MAAPRECRDEALKSASKEWWSRHSQDYVEPGEEGYCGVPPGLDDAGFLAYLDRIDANFQLDAYFAQGRGAPLFSGLMPVDWLRGKRVLEVGCGLGAHTEMLVRAGAEVTAVDLSATSVAVTRRRLSLKGLVAEVREADAESLPLPSDSVDCVWSWGVIHHSPDTKACADEIVRVLKPGGRLAIMLYHRDSLYNWINVIFRYGILRGELLTLSVQELHNRYTDGKRRGGAPLSKYYSRRDVRESLFPALRFGRQRAFEQKKAISNFFPSGMRRRVEDAIPDSLYTALWNRLGFLLFSEAEKPDSPDAAGQLGWKVKQPPDRNT